MTNHEARMTKEIRMTKSELRVQRHCFAHSRRASSLGILSSFVLRHSSFSLRVVLLVVIAFALGCRSVRRGEPIVGPFNSVDPDVQRGRLVFQENCYKCHPGGEGGLGPILNDKPFPRFLMKTQVRAGLGVMPAFHKIDIPPEELDALMKYIVAQRKHSGPIPQR